MMKTNDILHEIRLSGDTASMIGELLKEATGFTLMILDHDPTPLWTNASGSI